MLKNFLKGRKTEKGFTLVEFLVVLGLIFVLVAVIAMAAYKSTQRTRVSRAKSEVMTIVAAAEDWGGNKAKKFNGITMKKLADSGLLSSDLAKTKYLNPWGGKYDINPSGASDTTFTITINGMPTQQAVDLADNLRPISLDQGNSVPQGDTVTTEFR